MLMEIEIFEILSRNRNFFENIDWSRDFPNFEPKSKFFRKCWSKSRFSKFLTEIDFFFEIVDRYRGFLNLEQKSKMSTEIEVLEILNRNRNFFENVDRNRDFQPKSIFFRKSWPESISSKFFKGNRNFFENVDENRNNRNFDSKLKFFRKGRPKSRFSKFWDFPYFGRNRIFRLYLSKARFSIFWTEMEIFLKKLFEIYFFEILNRNWIFFENIDRKQDFRNV